MNYSIAIDSEQGVWIVVGLLEWAAASTGVYQTLFLSCLVRSCLLFSCILLCLPS